MIKSYDSIYWTGAKGSDTFVGLSLGFAIIGALGIVLFVLWGWNSNTWLVSVLLCPTAFIGLLFFATRMKRRYHILGTIFQVMFGITFGLILLVTGGFLLLLSQSDFGSRL